MSPDRPVYLDCCATTPVDEEVLEAMTYYFRDEYGNAGSRTHQYGNAAAQAIRKAREQVAAVVGASWNEVVFTSGATESNNLALLGLASKAAKLGKRHIISTQIEHKSVLEPLEHLETLGFEVTLLPPTSDGVVEAEFVREALRPDTFLVSVMHVNNETGVIQPIDEIAAVLSAHPAIFHTDATQGFGKDLDALRDNRVDLISVSAHKIFGPKGVGALIVKESSRPAAPQPLVYGGGQERGFRAGTLATPLIVGFGLASEIAVRDSRKRAGKCIAFRLEMMSALASLEPLMNGPPDKILPHIASLRFADIDSEAIMLGLKDLVAISNGSACTSANYAPSHVLAAMQMSPAEVEATTRWSWCHKTPRPSWPTVVSRIKSLC